MTKPITSVCLMQLYEEGRFQLGDNLSRYLPAFAQENMRVYTGGLRTSNGLMGAEGKMQWDSEPSDKPITIQMLLNHTAGLSYGFDAAGLVNPVDRLYHAIGPGLGGDREQGPDLTLEEYVDQLAAMPLACQPGSEWNYSLCVDVQGRLIEVLTGQSFGEALAERIFAPLGMTDTFFTVPFDKQSRFCPLYAPSPSKAGIVDISAGVAHQFIAGINGKPAAPKYESGGGGLVSSTHDYYQFAAMLLNGGLHAATGHRVLSRKTLQYMTINHLPDSLDMGALSAPQYSEIAGDGSGFGLGFSVILDPARNRAIGSVGNFAWGGAAATYFWVDPAEQLVVVLMTQLMGNGSQHPDSKYADLQKGVPLRPTVSQVVYSAVVDGTTVSAQRAPMLPPSGLARL
jgi:CubicO group peptidase (beta-lactamase class C family)